MEETVADSCLYRLTTSMVSYRSTLVVLSALDALVRSLNSSLHIWVDFEEPSKASFLAVLEQLVATHIRKPTRSIVDELTAQAGSKLLENSTFATSRCALADRIPIDAVEVANILHHAQLLGRVIQPKQVSMRLGHVYTRLCGGISDHILCPFD